AREQRRDTLKQKIFEPRTPAVAPEVLEGRNDAGGGERVPLPRHARERIKANRIVGVGDIEVAHLMRPARRQGINNGLRQVAMRIEDGDPVAGINIVHGEIEENGALAGPGLADNKHVALALFGRERDAAAGRRARNDRGVALHKAGTAPRAKHPVRNGVPAVDPRELATWSSPTMGPRAVRGGPP